MSINYFITLKAIHGIESSCLTLYFRTLLFFPLFLGINLFSFAQSTLIDSLKSKLTQIETSERFSPNEEYIEVLNRLSESYYNYFPDSTLYYAEKSKQLSEKLGYTEGLADAYRNIGAFNNKQGNYDTAIVIFKSGLQLAERALYKPGLANLYASIGLSYYETGFLAVATEYYLMSLKIKRDLGLNSEIANTLNNLGLIAIDRRQFQKAMEFFSEAKDIREKLGDKLGISTIDVNIALVLQKEGKHDISLQIFEEILAKESTSENKSLGSVSHYNIGEIYLAQNEFEKAITHYNKALELDQELNDRYGISYDLIGLAEAYLNLNQIPKSRELIEESLRVAEESGIKKNISESHRLLSRLFENQRNYQQALFHHQQYKIFEDSIFNTDTERLTEDLLIAYGLEKSALETQRIRRENELQREKQNANVIRNAAIALLLLMVLALYITIRSYRIQRKARLLVTQQKDELERLYLETSQQKEEIESIAKDLEEVNKTKDKLFGIVGHDLRSPINSLNSLMQYTMDESLSQEEFLQISHKLKNEVEHVHFTLNNLLNWAKSQMQGITSYPDFLNINELVEENIELYKPISTSKSIAVISKIAGETISWADREQINLVIRNLLNNALKFTPKNGTIEISSRLNKDNDWEISLRDNGIGMSTEIIDSLFKPNFHTKRYGTSGEKGTGLGLILVKDFLESNKGSIWVSSEVNKGSTFTFTLPVANGAK
ncbi:ATP-binding protein [Lunatibacter salilacus]|uniref:ATP-binding protein n=1 Tax=Lunatibacter salilacus TaxID=2483804 RepID=UPI00131C3156|nr:tetratricopeptide repeat protein [Lunatibacter salilacus]